MYRPNYKITGKILHHLTEIAAARQVIEDAWLIPKWEISLRSEALIHTTHSSTRIEGNTLSLEEVSQLALGRQVSAIRKDKQEVINYLNVLSHLHKYVPQTRFSIRDILAIHRQLTQKTLLRAKDEGALRNRQVVIGRRDALGRTLISFRPPPTKSVPNLLQGFLDWLNSPDAAHTHAVLASGVTHYEIVRIHPFVDGNGRTARVLATLLLFMRGFDAKRFFALDDYYDADREAYYDALRSVPPRTVEITHWLEYFCEGVAVCVNRVKDKILSLGGKSKTRGRLAPISQVSLSKRQMQIVEIINRQSSITNREVQKLYRISAQAAHKEMRKLVDQKVVRLVGKGRNASYQLA